MNTYPYNSAKAEFTDKNGVIDATLYFLQKPSTCPTTAKTYYGLPYANTTTPTSKTPDALCNNWYTFDDETVLKNLNKKILQGGYKIVISAYTSSSWTGTAVTKDVPIRQALLTSDQINASMFPVVQATSDSTGPYLSIPNASDYALIGSVCLSSNTASGFCDMEKMPKYTSHYSYNNDRPLLNTYRPIASDNWPAGQTIRTYFVHARDKYGRDLRVNN
jgi:hypothetical protein